MRRSITLLVAITTSAVVLAFVLPLGLLVQTLARDRALAGAAQDVQQVATILVQADDRDTLEQFVELVDGRSARSVGVRLADGTRIGTDVPPDDSSAMRTALAGTGLTEETGDEVPLGLEAGAVVTVGGDVSSQAPSLFA